MLIYEYKLDGTTAQYQCIEEAIRITQFIRNKCLRKWMDGRGVNKNDLQCYCAVLSTWMKYYAALHGTQQISVAPQRSSQECSGCGALVIKTLSTRTHVCPGCGLVLDRDVNAALVILARAYEDRTVGQTGTDASQSVMKRFWTGGRYSVMREDDRASHLEERRIPRPSRRGECQ